MKFSTSVRFFPHQCRLNLKSPIETQIFKLLSKFEGSVIVHKNRAFCEVNEFLFYFIFHKRHKKCEKYGRKLLIFLLTTLSHGKNPQKLRHANERLLYWGQGFQG